MPFLVGDFGYSIAWRKSYVLSQKERLHSFFLKKRLYFFFQKRKDALSFPAYSTLSSFCISRRCRVSPEQPCWNIGAWKGSGNEVVDIEQKTPTVTILIGRHPVEARIKEGQKIIPTPTRQRMKTQASQVLRRSPIWLSLNRGRRNHRRKEHTMTSSPSFTFGLNWSSARSQQTPNNIVGSRTRWGVLSLVVDSTPRLNP